MEYSPTGETKSSDIAVIGLFVLAVVSFGAAYTPFRFAWVMRAVGLFSLTAAVYIAVRYRLTRFVYLTGGDAGEEVFTVYRDRGRNKVAECRVSLSYLRSVTRFADRDAMKDARQGLEIYDYVQSMTPRSLVLAVFESTAAVGRDLGIILECDETFEQHLATFLSRNTDQM